MKGVNCCAELRAILDSGPDGGACPPGGGPCRGFDGSCGDIKEQFADVPVLPDYPDGMAAWACTAFPNTGEARLAARLCSDCSVVFLILLVCCILSRRLRQAGSPYAI